jgi:hypothetical protein
VLTFCSYLRVSYTSAAWPAILGITAIFTLSYLAAGYWMPFKNAGKSAVFAAPLLLITFPVLAFFEPSAASPAGFFSALFVLITAIAAYALVRREPLVHLLAAFFAIAAGLVWSAEYLDAPDGGPVPLPDFRIVLSCSSDSRPAAGGIG